MHKIVEGKLFVTFSYLRMMRVSDDTIWSGVKRNRTGLSTSWINIPNPSNKKDGYILYSSIPAATAERYALPSETELLGTIEQNEIKARAAASEMAAITRQVMRLDLVDQVEISLTETEAIRMMGLAETETKQYARLAGWIRVAMKVKQNLKAYQKVWKDMPTAMQAVADQMALEYRADVLPRPVISCPAVLLRKLKAYQEQGVQGLVSKKFGNQNRRIMDAFHQAVLVKLYCDSRKFDMLWIHDQYVRLMEEAGQTPVSYSRVKQFLQSDFIRTATFKERHGVMAAKGQKDLYLNRHRPGMSLSLVAGDGMMLGEQVMVPAGHKLMTGKMADRKKDYKGCLWVWFWYDVMSGAIAGYSIGISEDATMIRNAMRSLIRKCGDRVPRSVYIDKMWMDRDGIQQFMADLNIKFQPKEAWNAKENPAERFNQEFSRIHRKVSANWINITNHNIQFVRKLDQVDDKAIRHVDEARNMINDLVAAYNHWIQNNEKSRWQEMMDNINLECETLGAIDRVRLFGLEKKTRHSKGKFTLELESRKYLYKINELSEALLMLNEGERMRAMVDEEDLKTVHLFKMADEKDPLQDTYIGEASLVETFNMAIVEQTEADRKALGKQQQWKAGQEQIMDSYLEMNNVLIDRYSLMADVKGMGQKLIKEVLSQPDAIREREINMEEMGLTQEPIVQETKARKGGRDRFGELNNQI